MKVTPSLGQLGLQSQLQPAECETHCTPNELRMSWRKSSIVGGPVELQERSEAGSRPRAVQSSQNRRD